MLTRDAVTLRAKTGAADQNEALYCTVQKQVNNANKLQQNLHQLVTDKSFLQWTSVLVLWHCVHNSHPWHIIVRHKHSTTHRPINRLFHMKSADHNIFLPDFIWTLYKF